MNNPRLQVPSIKLWPQPANIAYCKYYEAPAALCLWSPVGHGQSEGERMNIKDFQIFIRDSLQHIDLMKSRHPDLPVFIVGHSMVRRHYVLSLLTGYFHGLQWKHDVLFCWLCCSWCSSLGKPLTFHTVADRVSLCRCTDLQVQGLWLQFPMFMHWLILLCLFWSFWNVRPSRAWPFYAHVKIIWDWGSVRLSHWSESLCFGRCEATGSTVTS